MNIIDNYNKTRIKYPVADDKYQLGATRFYRKFPPPSFPKSQLKRNNPMARRFKSERFLKRTKIRAKPRGWLKQIRTSLATESDSFAIFRDQAERTRTFPRREIGRIKILRYGVGSNNDNKNVSNGRGVLFERDTGAISNNNRAPSGAYPNVFRREIGQIKNFAIWGRAQ